MEQFEKMESETKGRVLRSEQVAADQLIVLTKFQEVIMIKQNLCLMRCYRLWMGNIDATIKGLKQIMEYLVLEAVFGCGILLL